MKPDTVLGGSFHFPNIKILIDLKKKKKEREKKAQNSPQKDFYRFRTQAHMTWLMMDTLLQHLESQTHTHITHPAFKSTETVTKHNGEKKSRVVKQRVTEA